MTHNVEEHKEPPASELFRRKLKWKHEIIHTQKTLANENKTHKRKNIHTQKLSKLTKQQQQHQTQNRQQTQQNSTASEPITRQKKNKSNETNEINSIDNFTLLAIQCVDICPLSNISASFNTYSLPSQSARTISRIIY